MCTGPVALGRWQVHSNAGQFFKDDSSVRVSMELIGKPGKEILVNTGVRTGRAAAPSPAVSLD